MVMAPSMKVPYLSETYIVYDVFSFFTISFSSNYKKKMQIIDYIYLLCYSIYKFFNNN